VLLTIWSRKVRTIKKWIILDADPVTVIDGVNAFYGDYKNRKIPVPWAIYYVLESIHGKSKKLMQTYLERIRQITSSCSYSPYAPDIEESK